MRRTPLTLVQGGRVPHLRCRRRVQGHERYELYRRHSAFRRVLGASETGLRLLARRRGTKCVLCRASLAPISDHRPPCRPCQRALMRHRCLPMSDSWLFNVPVNLATPLLDFHRLASELRSGLAPVVSGLPIDGKRDTPPSPAHSSSLEAKAFSAGCVSALARRAHVSSLTTSVVKGPDHCQTKLR